MGKYQIKKNVISIVVFIMFSTLNAEYLYDGNWRWRDEIRVLGIPFFANGLQPVNIEDKYGYIDTTGNIVIPPEFDYAQGFIDGTAIVRNGSRYLGKYGCIDTTGKVIVPLKYNWLDIYEEDLAVVKIDNKWGFVDKKGVEVIPLIFDMVREFQNGLAAAKLNGKWGLINHMGQFIVENHYEAISNSINNNLVIVAINNKVGVINTANDYIIPPVYDDIIPGYDISDTSIFNPFFQVRVKGKHGAIDLHGNVIIPLIYQDMRYLSDGMTTVKYKDKWGLINKNGKIIADYLYDNWIYFNVGDSIALAQNGNMYSILNRQGKVIFKTTLYDEIYYPSEGLMRVKRNNHYGYINATGKEIVPVIYDDASYKYENGIACVRLDQNEAVYNKNGNIVVSFIDTCGHWEPETVIMESISPGLIRVMSNNGYGFVDTRGYVLIKPIFSLIETDTIGKYFYVEQKDRVNKTKTVGYINREENWIYKQIKPMVYDSLRRYWK